MYDIEFLDWLAIVGFGMQMQLYDQLQADATNKDILEHLHKDISVVNAKLDAIIKHLGIELA